MRFRFQTFKRACWAVLFILGCWRPGAYAQTASPTDDFANKSIEELMNIDVTSVSRKEQKLSKIPAAVYVITREAIQRSGATTIPDLLRIVPGVQVAQMDANRWAVSVRGFNGIYSNKLLVLIDGRTVYTPSFSGVYWNQIDMPLDTIDRIEVVRGPGGTVWGANAVNGVINIITEHSKETQGTIISAGGGSFQTGNYQARYGGKLGQIGTYRAFGDFSSFGDLLTAQGQNGHDGWQSYHGGFRMDLSKSARDGFILEGNIFRTDGGQVIAPAEVMTAQPVTDHGFDVMGRWTHTHSDTSQSSLQVYGSRYTRLDSGLTEQVSAVDLDFQNHTSLGSRNDVVWGLGYRLNSDNISSNLGQTISLQTLGFYAQVLPRSKDYSLFSSFFQDEISITNSVALTIGSKVEHNAFTGFEFEPSIRLAWTPTDAHTVWISASKAVRQPSRFDTGVDVQLPLIYMGRSFAISQQISGSTQFQAETIRAYEAGYRTALSRRVSLDLSTFYNFYRDLKNSFLAPPRLTFTPDLSVLTLPVVYGNGLRAQSYGGEANIMWNALSRWKLSTSYSVLRTNIYPGPSVTTNPALLLSQVLPAALAGNLRALASSISTSDSVASGPAPRQQWSAQSYWDISPKLYFDSSVYYVGRLREISVPAYTRIDAHFAYKLRKGIELSIVGQNLAAPRHLEFANAQQALETQAERNVSGRMIWSF